MHSWKQIISGGITIHVRVIEFIILFSFISILIYYLVPRFFGMKVEKVELDEQLKPNYSRQIHFLVSNYNNNRAILDTIAMDSICNRIKSGYASNSIVVVFYHKSWKVDKEYLENRSKPIFHNPDKEERLADYNYQASHPRIIKVTEGNFKNIISTEKLALKCK